MAKVRDPLQFSRAEAVTLLFKHAYDFFIDGLLLMLAFGILHASSHTVPAFGYWQSAFVAMVLGGICTTGTYSLMATVRRLGRLVDTGE